jgi:hypothetical protein
LPWLAYADALNGGVAAVGRQVDGLRWVYLKDYIALRRRQAGAPAATLAKQDWLDLIAGRTDSQSNIVCAILALDDPEPFVRMIESLFEKNQYYCAC